MSNNPNLISPRFSVRTANGIVVVSLQDRAFLNSQVQEFSRILEDVKTGTEKKVILDFSRCSYISSDGLNTTAQFWKWCKKEKTVAIAIVAVDDKHNEIRNLFDIIGLSAMVGEALAPTVEKAVEFLQKPQ